MNLKDKLARLDKNSSQTPIQKTGTVQYRDWAADFQRELDARILSEGNSFIIMKENYYPVYRNPDFEKLRSNGFIVNQFDRITGDRSTGTFNLQKYLFIDTETTGLAGGTGTYAFLVGIGHIELDHIVVRQYVLPDFQHEWLLLKHVENRLVTAEGIGSFNGKSYDIPLLRTRFVLNRIDSVLDDLPHIDILHAARRIWKQRLGSCTLQDLEYAILGQERVGDIPGEMIPQIYFDFIRKRNATLLRDVLEHNFFDIVHLVLLTIEIVRVLEAPRTKLTHPQDLFSLARYFYQQKQYDIAIPLFEQLSRQENAEESAQNALYFLAMTHKKLGERQKSSAVMHRLLEVKNNHPGALEELAKYYEHVKKEYRLALDLVKQGLNHIEMMEQLGRNAPIAQLKDNLLYRRNRLRNKLAKKS